MVLLKCKFKKRKATKKKKILISINSYGGAFVECSLQHPSEIEIVQLVFRINEVKTKKKFFNQLNISLFSSGCIDKCMSR